MGLNSLITLSRDDVSRILTSSSHLEDHVVMILHQSEDPFANVYLMPVG
jgi:hypothetical protein